MPDAVLEPPAPAKAPSKHLWTSESAKAANRLSLISRRLPKPPKMVKGTIPITDSMPLTEECLMLIDAVRRCTRTLHRANLSADSRARLSMALSRLLGDLRKAKGMAAKDHRAGHVEPDGGLME